MYRIRDLREDADLRQSDMAKILNMQTTVYRRYENEEREVPLNIAIAIAQHYNVSLDYVAGLIDQPRPLYKKQK